MAPGNTLLSILNLVPGFVVEYCGQLIMSASDVERVVKRMHVPSLSSEYKKG